MNRLVQPNPSARAELCVYASLGFAAVVTVVIALGATFNFATDLDRIASRLKPAPATVARTAPVWCEQNSLTNIADTELRPSQPGEAKTPPAASTVRGKADLPTG